MAKKKKHTNNKRFIAYEMPTAKDIHKSALDLFDSAMERRQLMEQQRQSDDEFEKWINNCYQTFPQHDFKDCINCEFIIGLN
ncbi:MAG: hypothetical protein JST75_14875 [Bacteroidetes bacterium]|nr:hypothetical protein [Bacteroidota bacterium]